MFVPSLRRSQLSWPGKRMEHVMPERPADTKWLRSPYVGVVSFRVLKPMLRLTLLITCPISSNGHSCSLPDFEQFLLGMDWTIDPTIGCVDANLNIQCSLENAHRDTYSKFYVAD